MRKMDSIRSLLAVLLLMGILGSSAVLVRANEAFVYHSIQTTVFDPSDGVHGGQNML